MKNTLKTLRLPALFILSSGMLFGLASIVTYISRCTYDDLPNTWSCNQGWAISAMNLLDPIIIFIGYPLLIIGALLLIIKILRSLFRF